MQTNLDLARFRRDRCEQKRTETAMTETRRAWSAHPKVRPILDQLEHFGAGGTIRDFPELAGMFEKPGEAQKFAEGCIAGNLAAMSRHPLGQPAFATQSSGAANIMLLAKSGRAELSLVCFVSSSGSDSPGPQSAQFVDADRFEAILAGSAEATFVRRRPEAEGSASLSFTSRGLSAGDLIRHRGSLEAKCLGKIHGRLVLLRLARASADPEPVREYRFSDGALLSQSSGNKRESCQEMMLTVLGRMGRKDAVPAIAELATTGSDHVRWEAMRQCLSLDAARGFAILEDMARSSADPLARQAGALRAQLIETYPSLA